MVTKSRVTEPYDLVVGAVGVNAGSLDLLDGLGLKHKPPDTTKTYICELPLGEDAVVKHLGSSMHVFLLNVPRLEFAALVPKSDFVTVVLLGTDIDNDLVTSFLRSPEVRRVLPPDWETPEKICHCSPRISMREAIPGYVDRLVLVGDCGVSRLFKDGIGAAYRAAKAVASTAVIEGVSAKHFRRHYQPAYSSIASDNVVGKLIFAVTALIQSRRYARRAILKIVKEEQVGKDGPRRLSGVLWDTFTGSAPYKDVFMRTLHPAFIVRMVWNVALALLNRNSGGRARP